MLMVEAKHPGTVIFVDARTKEVTERVPAAELPLSMQFEDTSEGKIPVVRIEVASSDEIRTLTFFGPNGEFLRSTMQIAEGEAPPQDVRDDEEAPEPPPFDENP